MTRLDPFCKILFKRATGRGKVLSRKRKKKLDRQFSSFRVWANFFEERICWRLVGGNWKLGWFRRLGQSSFLRWLGFLELGRSPSTSSQTNTIISPDQKNSKYIALNTAYADGFRIYRSTQQAAFLRTNSARCHFQYCSSNHRMCSNLRKIAKKKINFIQFICIAFITRIKKLALTKKFFKCNSHETLALSAGSPSAAAASERASCYSQNVQNFRNISHFQAQ